MGVTAFPNGVSSFGIPVMGGGLIPTTTGKYLFVHSVTGSNGNNGFSKDAPKATVAGAVAACDAGKNDVIVVMPGHAETVTSTSLTLSVAGVTVVNLGYGANRPTYTFSGTGSTILVSSADDCVWQGGLFVPAVANVTAAFTLSGSSDFALTDSEAVDGSASLSFLSIIVTGTTDHAADGLRVQRNKWYSLDTAPLAFISILGDLDRLLVTDNFVNMDAATNDVAHFITLTSDTILGAQILRNVLIVLGATGQTVGIFLTGSSTDNTGVVAFNLVASLDTTTELIATAGTGLKFFENYYTGNADASGKLWPVVDTA